LFKPLFGEWINGLFGHSACLFQPPFQFFPIALLQHGDAPYGQQDRQRQIVHLKLEFRRVLELGDLPIPLPEFNVVAVNKLFRSLHGLVIVGAFQWNRIKEVPIGADDVNAVFRHVAAPLGQAGALQNSLSPIVTVSRAAMAFIWWGANQIRVRNRMTIT
jgi:hypothetical protein